MTTAIAYGVDGKVYMAADSMTNVFARPVASAKKIARLPVPGTEDEALMAVAGFGGLGQWIHYEAQLPHFSVDSGIEQWAQEVAALVTRTSIDRGFTDEGRIDACVLLGFRGRVWTLDHFYAIAHPDNIGAIGSGEGPAIGALDALLHAYDQWFVKDEETHADVVDRIVRAAVTIAKSRDKHTGGEIQVEQA